MSARPSSSPRGVPSPRRLRSVFCLARIPLFNGLNLLQAANMPFLLGETGTHKGADELPGHFDTDDPFTHHQHIHVVVLYPLMGRIGVMADSGPDAGNLVGGDRG